MWITGAHTSLVRLIYTQLVRAPRRVDAGAVLGHHELESGSKQRRCVRRSWGTFIIPALEIVLSKAFDSK